MEDRITCQFCLVFEKAEPIIKNNKQFRKCPKIRKLVTYKKEICADFKLAKLVLCERKNIFIPIKQCFKNREKAGTSDFSYCRGCITYTFLLNAIEKDPEKPFQKKTLKKRTKLLRRRV